MDSKSVEKTKSSRKKKTLSLIDFIVKSKQKTEKSKTNNKKITKKVTNNVANVFVRRGKVKKKKQSTLKKKILKLRNKRKSADTEEKESESEEDDDQSQDDPNKVESGEIDEDWHQQVAAEVLNVADKISEIVLNEDHRQLDNEIESINDNNVVDLKCTGVQHSRNFRDYCNHFITNEIRNLTVEILESLLKFQENKYQENPTRAKSHKRYVVGFKEVKKFLVVGRLKLLVIAPDLEKNDEVDKIVDELKVLSDKKSIPYVFSIKRRKIGYILLKKVPVSVIGIFDYQGVHGKVQDLLQLVNEEKINYQRHQS